MRNPAAQNPTLFSAVAPTCVQTIYEVQVQPWSMEPYPGHHLYDWIAALLAFIGLWVVLPGTYLKLIETLNTDYDMRVHTWEQQGKKGLRPR